MTFIRVPPDSTGKQVETNTPNTDHRQVVTLGDSAAANTASVNSSSQLQVVAQPTDGTHPLSTFFDADSGAGTQWLQGVVLRKSASGGSVEAGTSSDPLRVDPTGTTVQPVSGTVTTSPPANASTNVAQVSGTTADTNSGLKSAGTLRVVLATDQPALTAKLLVTPDSVALPANQSTNVAQVAGTTTDTNSGNKSAGTIRMVLATDQPALTNKLLVTPDSVALPANQSVNVAQMNGVATSMGTGIMGTGVQRVAIASDNDAVTVKQATGTNLHAVLDANSGVDIGKLTANQSTNVAQINGVTPLMGTGIMGTGSHRVTIASDNDALTVKQATAANLLTTARVIGNAGASFDSATAAAVPANALLDGLRGSTTNPTAVSDAQMVAARGDKLGRLNVVAHQVRDLISHQTTQIASSSSETTIVTAGAAGVFNDIISIVLTNETATACTVTFKDSTAGTTRFIVALAASGGAVICPSAPIPQLAAAANNWTATLSVATVTVDIFIHYAKNI